VIGDTIKHLLDASHPSLRALSALVRLALVVVLIAVGLAHNAAPLPPLPSNEIGDVALYERIVSHIRDGGSYYPAAVGELRDHGYPLRPFVTVRLPTLAWLLALLPNDPMRRASLALLALTVAAAWAWRLGRAGFPAIQYAVALLGLTVGMAAAFVPGAPSLHEVWAGLLIALSMALRRPDGWLTAVLIGTVAALLRELAAPYLLVMALMALSERRYREAGAWCAGLAVFVVALAAHAHCVNELVSPTDRSSPSWLALGGWRFVLQTAYWGLSMLNVGGLVAVLLPLALLGLTARPIDERLLLTVVGYTVGFLLVGRSDTSYWGLIVAPLWPLGLAMAWPALVQCASDLRLEAGRRESSAARAR
jgi:hypothetical protein